MASGADDPIPLTVIGGYLGAGKTTLLNRLLESSSGRRLGVVVNDFGEIGIDAELLAEAAGDAPVINLANGCVCCTLGDDLGATLQDLASLSPPLDHILVEASGVSDPAGVAAWGTVAPFVPGGVVVLAAADTIRAQSSDRYVGGEILRQLRSGDLLVLTKADRCSNGEVDDVRAWLGGISAAPVVDAPHGQIDPDLIVGPSAALSVSPVEPSHHVRHELVRWRWTGEGTVSRDDLDEFLRGLPPGILRLKGLVALDNGGHAVVQVVGSSIAVSIVSAGRDGSVLVAIGVAGRFVAGDLTARAADHLPASTRQQQLVEDDAPHAEAAVAHD